MNTNDFMKRSWVEINLEKLKKNYIVYKRSANNEIMPVVKADAYGHGAVIVSKALQDAGASRFAVSNMQEGIELRENGINGEILVLGYTPINELDNVVKYDITQALLSEEYTKDVIKSGFKVKCHYAIDTGMNRIGLDAQQAENCVVAIEEAAKYLDLKGIFTHLCVADIPEEKNFTNKQLKLFDEVIKSVSHLKLADIHCLNSAGGLWFNRKVSYTRVGIVLYGLKPDFRNELPNGIEPILEWKSVVSMIKKVYPGETIGYGRTYKVKKEMIIATISTGYADGYNTKLSNVGYVLIRGKKAPIVGRICMDQFMVDITDIAGVKQYDEVVLIGKNGEEEIKVHDIAQKIGSIDYEIVCNISKRVTRVYI